MTIGKKIISGYLVVLVMLVMVTGVAFYSLKSTEDIVRAFYKCKRTLD